MSNYAAEVMSILIMTIIRTLGQAFAFWVVLPLWALAYEALDFQGRGDFLNAD